MVKYVRMSSCAVHVIPIRFKLNLKFLDRFSTNNQISDFVKLSLVGA